MPPDVVRTKYRKLKFDQQACPRTFGSALGSFTEAEAEAETKAEVGVNDLFNGGAPQSQQTINANELDIGSEDLQKCCANEASQA